MAILMIDSPYHVQSCAVFHGNALFLESRGAGRHVQFFIFLESRGPYMKYKRGPGQACGNIDSCCLSVVTNDFREL